MTSTHRIIVRCKRCRRRIPTGKEGIKVALISVGVYGPIEARDPLYYCGLQHAEKHCRAGGFDELRTL